MAVKNEWDPYKMVLKFQILGVWSHQNEYVTLQMSVTWQACNSFMQTVLFWSIDITARLTNIANINIVQLSLIIRLGEYFQKW